MFMFMFMFISSEMHLCNCGFLFAKFLHNLEKLCKNLAKKNPQL